MENCRALSEAYWKRLAKESALKNNGKILANFIVDSEAGDNLYLEYDTYLALQDDTWEDSITFSVPCNFVPPTMIGAATLDDN